MDNRPDGRGMGLNKKVFKYSFTIFNDQFNDILHFNAGSSAMLRNLTYFRLSFSFQNL